MVGFATIGREMIATKAVKMMLVSNWAKLPCAVIGIHFDVDSREEKVNLFKTQNVTHCMIDEKLLEILACPKCKGDIRLEGDRLICSTCKLAYPIKNDIPVMLIDEAEKLK